MEHISNQLTTWGNQLALQDSSNLPSQLTPTEVQIIEKKYASKRIKELSPAEILTKVFESLTRIHVITGWTIPNDDLYMKLLSEEVQLKLIEDFGEINFDELIFAFRKNVGVKDWGKSMNLQLISDVLSSYLSERATASESEARSKVPEQVIYTAEELDNVHRADVEAFYQRCLKGITPPNELPPYFLNILIQDGYMAEGSDDLHGFFAYWINKGYKNIYLKS